MDAGFRFFRQLAASHRFISHQHL